MADKDKATDGPTPFEPDAYDFTLLPDYDNDFVHEPDVDDFAEALAVPETSPSQDDLTHPAATQARSNLFITALNDWRPVRQRVRRKKTKKPPRRGKDETREGFVYTLLKWPLLLVVFGWLVFLTVSYLLTRFYIFLYERLVTWRGRREKLRKDLQSQRTYEDWVSAAKKLDTHLGNEKWKHQDEYAYYNSKTIRRVKDHMAKLRVEAEKEEYNPHNVESHTKRAIDELHGLVEACVKNNFAGSENPRLYSETYYGTKNLVQAYVDEAEASLTLLLRTKQLSSETKRTLFKHLHTNFGRTALCLSGGATFAYYHFGIIKALLDADLLPEVITGTSGGALVAGLIATRTNEELKKLIVPALAHRITACEDDWTTWARRSWKTGARFDNVSWARKCMWFCRGSMTFREAFERTGRVLNVTCVPSDPHSPTILANYLTSPDCVVWSAVLASAAVPGILNPVVLMKKMKYRHSDGTEKEKLEPYSFGHKWKDGSLRTDIPLKALNLHFNVNFSIVSQVNPHINLFFFSSRGTVGRPVTHRRGRGWRGGFLGSAIEQYLKLDLTKWLKVLRHLELLPRPLGQDWSEIWLQRFSGTITIWPKSLISDFYYILTDPTPERLARMIRVGQLSAWPKVKFIGNRMKIERLIQEGRRTTRPQWNEEGGLENVLSSEDLRGLLREARQHDGMVANIPATTFDDNGYVSNNESDEEEEEEESESEAPRHPLSNDADELRPMQRSRSSSMTRRLTGWWQNVTNSPRSIRTPKTASIAGDTGSPNEEEEHDFTRSTSALPSPPSHNGTPGHRTPYSMSTDRSSSMFELRPPAQQREQENEKKRHYGKLYAQGQQQERRRASLISELARQSQVFFDDPDFQTPKAEKHDFFGHQNGTWEKALEQEKDWEVEEDKEKLGMGLERAIEDDATQKFSEALGEDGHGTRIG